MKQICKFLKLVFSFAAVMVGTQAFAQFTGPNLLALPSTFSTAAATTNTTYSSSNWTAAAVSSRGAGTKLGVAVNFKLTAAGTSAVVFKFDSSIDGANWETGTFSITQAASGTTAVTKHGSFDLGALPYIRLSSIENPNASGAVTNVTIRTGFKHGS